MKRKLIYIFLLILIIIGVVYIILKPTYSHHRTDKIPDTDLQAIIYLQDNFKTMSIGSGEGSYALSYIELQDLEGNTLAKQNIFNRCEVQIGEIYLEKKNNKLYFTKFSYIDLTDYSYYCFGNGM